MKMKFSEDLLLPVVLLFLTIMTNDVKSQTPDLPWASEALFASYQKAIEQNAKHGALPCEMHWEYCLFVVSNEESFDHMWLTRIVEECQQNPDTPIPLHNDVDGLIMQMTGEINLLNTFINQIWYFPGPSPLDSHGICVNPNYLIKREPIRCQ